MLQNQTAREISEMLLEIVNVKLFVYRQLEREALPVVALSSVSTLTATFQFSFLCFYAFVSW